MITTYIVKDKNGNVVAEGNITRVTTLTGMSKANIYGLVKGTEMGYTAEAIQIAKLPRKKIGDAKEKDTLPKYVKRHLLLYGNTVLNKIVTEKDIIKIREELKQEGIDFTYEYKRYDEGYGGWLLQLKEK